MKFFNQLLVKKKIVFDLYIYVYIYIYKKPRNEIAFAIHGYNIHIYIKFKLIFTIFPMTGTERFIQVNFYQKINLHLFRTIYLCGRHWESLHKRLYKIKEISLFTPFFSSHLALTLRIYFYNTREEIFFPHRRLIFYALLWFFRICRINLLKKKTDYIQYIRNLNYIYIYIYIYWKKKKVGDCCFFGFRCFFLFLSEIKCDKK